MFESNRAILHMSLYIDSCSIMTESTKKKSQYKSKATRKPEQRGITLFNKCNLSFSRSL